MPVLFAEIASELDLSILQVGTIWGASSAAGIFSILPVGFLADRYGVRRVLAVFCLAAGVFGASRGLSTDMPTLVVTSVLFGIAATMTVESEGIGPEYAGTAVGIVHGFTRLGYTIAPPAGMPYAFWAGLCGLALLFFLFVPETGRRSLNYPAPE